MRLLPMQMVAGKTRVDEAELRDATREVGWRNCPKRLIGRCIRSPEAAQLQILFSDRNPCCAGDAEPHGNLVLG